MYNHYLDGLDSGGFVLLDPEPQGQPGQGHQEQRNSQGQARSQHPHRPNQPHSNVQHRPAEPIPSKNDLLKDVTGGLSQLLEGVFKHFSLEHFDTGDILLVLIILFLYLEDGDNLELVITLGLLLLLGLDDSKEKESGLTPPA